MVEENFDINPDTGLPELPEGYAWYVAESKEGGHPVIIICRVSHTWSRVTPIENQSEFFTATSKSREDSYKRTHENDFLASFGIKTRVRYTVNEYIRYVAETGHTVAEWSESEILAASFYLLERWSAERERSLSKARLSGPYPPNKLKNEEE